MDEAKIKSVAPVGPDGFPKSGWIPPAGTQAVAAPPAVAQEPAAGAVASTAAQPPVAPIAKIAGEPQTYVLDHPVEFDGNTYAVVTIRGARAGDLARIDKQAGPRALQNVALLIATPEGKPVPLTVIEAMEIGDGNAVTDMAEPFLQRVIAPKTTACFEGAEHANTILLQYPVRFGGRVYDRVVVRRMTIGDFRAYFALPSEHRTRFPAFVDDSGAPLPNEVLDALAFDDNTRLSDANELFLPAAFRAEAATAPTSAPALGDPSPQS